MAILAVYVKRLLCLLLPVCACLSQPSPAEKLIEDGHWKRARALVEARLHDGAADALSSYLQSQISNAFGDQTTTLALAEKAVALDGHTAKFHRQVAEVLGVMAESANMIQQLLLAQRFRKEIDAALALDPRDVQALRDLLEFYLLAPGIAGGDPRKAAPLAARIGAINSPLGHLAEARIATFHKDVTGMEASLRKAAEASPPSYNAHIAVARFYLDPTHFNAAAAEAEAREALKLDPNRVEAYSLLAEILAGRGDWTELESTLTAAAAAVPDDLVPYYRAAQRLLTNAREPERAERYLRVYMSQQPEGNEPTTGEAAHHLERIHRKRVNE